ncbi:uncharacterized protein LOC123562157 [Mercenaria mercenaria]|uniref:uncharacterized protein LOC123562157 n=1 Tax=Mercenaria mercenaria TaxID=6596 RepID=UPI00234FB20D|nr:uncharacterized protein LOC123562157 [Mercenaria mercenaria]
MGVTAETDVDYGRIYGPFPAVGHIPQSHFIGYLTADDRHDTGGVKINLNDTVLGNTWLPYVHPARTVDEQNMEAYMKDGNIFYRTLRIIRAGEELLVWYSKDFAQILEIPLSNIVQREDNDTKLVCDKCGEKFRYIFPLMAHLRFRCTKVAGSQYSSNISLSPTASHSNSAGESGTDKLAMNKDSKGLKRSLETDPIDLQRKKLFLETREENNNEQTPGTSHEKSTSPGSINAIGQTAVRDIGSAFRKVEKSFVRENISPVEDIQLSNKHSHSLNETKMTLHKEHEIIARHLYNKGMLPQSSVTNGLPVGLGMLSPGWMAPVSSVAHSYLDPRVYSERVQVSAVNKPQMVSPVGNINQEAIRNLQNGDMFSKQMLMEQLRKSHLPFMPTANPMVEKILQTATPTMVQRPIQPVSLAQNWCAKCNATFRMTSDLVYHMRSHHKREFDPIKKKREDKLQCNVCKETFKERHHLTRHMTSHT